jgi:hypothetical protein
MISVYEDPGVFFCIMPKNDLGVYSAFIIQFLRSLLSPELYDKYRRKGVLYYLLGFCLSFPVSGSLLDGELDNRLDSGLDGGLDSGLDVGVLDGVGLNGSGPSFTLNIVPTKRTTKINTNRVIARALNTFERSIGDIQ